MSGADETAGLEAEFVRRCGKSPGEASPEELRDFLIAIEAEAEGNDGLPATPAAAAPMNIHIDPSEWEGKLKAVCGSQSDHFNNEIADQVARSLWPYADPAMQQRQLTGSMAALAGIGPRDELEGMLAAQIIGMHNVAMECIRKSMMPDLSVEIRAMNIAMSNKTARSFATLIEALGKYRGKGQQKVVVEHVYVAAGGQAFVGVAETQGGGGGSGRKSGKRPHARQIGHASEPAMPGQNSLGQVLSAGCDEERALPNARRAGERRSGGEPQCLEARCVHGPVEGRTAEAGADDAACAAPDQGG